ncbi:MAG: endonuclease/exonuclease/phosphatase family protein [Bacteroidales bacterium]|nr:endonuclease/exonuclease/phosphatase family protein [Bacteroidales bacterium]
MPYYKPIRHIEPIEARHRLLDGLKRLRAQLSAEMPRKTRDATLILGSWNIRNFDDNRFMNGYRSTEDLQYLAEIISHFDVLAVQEICSNLGPLDKLLTLLGRDYDYIITDVTEGRGGNDERLGFIFDRSKVTFRGVAGELVLPEKLLITSEGKRLQFARTPFICSFQSGWFKFLFATVHIYFGKDTGAGYRRRVSEISQVAKFIAERAANDDQNHILVGDFNIIRSGSEGYNALKAHGFEIFQNKEGSNKDQTKFYDQISFRTRPNELRFADSGRNRGVFQFFRSIYREEDFLAYKDDLRITVDAKVRRIEAEIEELKMKISRARTDKSREKCRKEISDNEKDILEWKAHLTDDHKMMDYYISEWRTFHGSDHLPLWVELEIDFSDSYLDRLATLSVDHG